jgi:hypothetical protein
MILDKEQIINKIERGGHTYMQIFEGHKNLPDGALYFEVLKGDSADELAEKFAEFADMYAGSFSLKLSKGNSTGASPFFAKCKITKQQDTPATAQPLNGTLSSEDIEKRIGDAVARVRAEDEQKRKELEVTELRAQIVNIEASNSKYGAILAEAAKALFPQLNAILPATGSAMNGTPEYTAEQIEDINAALGILVGVLGEQTIINLAKKINTPEGQGMIPMIKNYANG